VTVFAIPAPARALLTRAAAPLVQCLDAVGRDDALVLGGGTALAARWQHRQSTDIDLWLPDNLFFQHQAYLVELLQKTFQVHAHIQERDDGTRTLAGITPEGEFTIWTVPPLLPAIIPSAVVANGMPNGESGWNRWPRHLPRNSGGAWRRTIPSWRGTSMTL